MKIISCDCLEKKDVFYRVDYGKVLIYNGEATYGESNYIEPKYCPFCGKKIEVK